MITLSEGSKEMIPFVQVEITTGRFPFYYWYEVHIWNEKEQVWYHDIDKDGGCFTLWRTIRKCKEVLSDAWFEELSDKEASQLDHDMWAGRGKM